MVRLASGIAGFDGLVSGGFPADASVVLQGPPGQEKLAFALAFLSEGLRTGGSGLAVVASQSPESLLKALRGLGVDVDLVLRENRLRIVDWYSWGEETVTDVEERGAILRSSVDLANAGAALSRAIAGLAGDGLKRAIVEMLSPALNVYELSQVYAFAQSTKRKFDRFHFTALFLLEKEMHTAPVLSTLHQPFDGVVEMERTRSGDRILRKIGILHLRDTRPVSDFIPFEFTEQGIHVGIRPPAPTPSPETAPPPPPPPAPPRPRTLEGASNRVRLIMEIARERLRADPEDCDALFSLAAALATVDDPRDAVRTLERLETINPNYPGLWAFEMKLFARLGDAERWQRSRKKALAESPTSEDAGSPPCPFCHEPVSPGSAQCPHCMADLREETDMLHGLEKLVRATVRETVPEEPERNAPPSQPAPLPLRPVAKPISLKPVPRSKGMTNGLILERHPVRPVPVVKSGRTNGLTNGRDGRTNGLTNGLRGRTNGLTNGLGRTNGLTNGVGRTNGLTNGVGRTNGLTKGLEKAARSRSFLGRTGLPKWERIALPAALVVLLILLPLVFLWSVPSPVYPIRMDGSFADWASVSKLDTLAPPGLNPDIDLTHVAVKDNLDYLAFYLEARGSVLAGQVSGGQAVNAFYAFIDTDRSRSTGYQVQGIGADRLIGIDTWGGRVVGSSLMEFDPAHGPRDWTGWTAFTTVQAAGSGNQLEFQVLWSALALGHGPVDVAFASRSWDGQSDAGDVVATDASPYVLVSQDSYAPTVLSSVTPNLSRFTFHAVDGGITITSLNVTFQGTFASSGFSAVDLVDETGSVVAARPMAPVVRFDFAGFVVPGSGNRTLAVQPKASGADGSTVGGFIENIQDVVVASGGVAFANPARTPETLAYVGAIPNAAVVDGGFSDWPSVTADPVRDVQPQWNADVDLSGYAFRGSNGSAFFMAQLVGTALNGTMVPALNPTYSPPSNGTGNGTLSPPPPPENGTDVVRMFLDADGSSATGFSVGGIGADLLVEITGKEGLILASQAEQFTGTVPWEWSWRAIGAAPVAKDRSRIEAVLPGIPITNASRAYFDASGWGGSHDDTSSVAPFKTLSGPFLMQTLSLSPMSALSLSPVSSGIGSAAGDEYGFNLTGVGRINAASGGNESFAVGAPYAAGGRGSLSLFFGYDGWSAANINAASANVTIIGQTAGDHFGWSLADAGDVNGDGIGDVLVGAPDAGAGKAYLIYGRTSWAGVSGQAISAVASVVTIAGQNPGDRFGASVSGIGNVDNAGSSDFAVGAPSYGSSRGRVYLFYGNGAVPSSANQASLFLDGASAGDEFGFSLAGGGNVNGDAYADFVVGAPAANKAYVYTLGINPVTNGFLTSNANGWTYGENDPNSFDSGVWDNTGGSGADLSGAGSYKLGFVDSASILTLTFHAESITTNTVSELALLSVGPDGSNSGTAIVVTAAASGDHLILGTWTTPALGLSALPAGTWTLSYNGKAGNAITGHFDVHIFKKSSAGVLAAIDGTSGADNVDGVATSSTMTQSNGYLTGTYAMSSTALATTDALVLKLYAHAVTVSGGQPQQRQITFNYDGSNANSNLVAPVAYPAKLNFHIETGGVNGVVDKQLLTSGPDQATAQLVTVSITNPSRYLVGEWITPQLGLTTIPAGDWVFLYWGSTTSLTTATFDVHLFKRSSAGLVTSIDGTNGQDATRGVAITGLVGGSTAEFNGTVRLGAISLASTDALVVRVYLNVTANSGTRTGTFLCDSSAADSLFLYPGQSFTDRLYIASAASFTSPPGTYSSVRYRFSYAATVTTVGSASYHVKYQIRDAADTTTVMTAYDSGALTTSQAWSLHTSTFTGLSASTAYRVRVLVEVSDPFQYETPSIAVNVDDIGLQFENPVALSGSAGTNFGWAVATVAPGSGYASFHNDAYAAVVVGAPSATNGQVSVYYGSPSFSGTLGAGIAGVASGDKFGYSVSSAEDLNGDGIADLVVGAPYHAGGATASGAVYVFTGSSSTPPASASNADQTANGENANDHYGWSVSAFRPSTTAGTFLLVGAPNYGPNPNTNEGKAYVVAIPEFGDVLLPIATIVVFVLGFGRRSQRRKGRAAWVVPRH